MFNFIANIPIYIGLFFRVIGDKLFTVSFKLHMTFNTETGKKMKELEVQVKNLAKTMKGDQQAAGSGGEDRKLINILNDANNGTTNS
jgi:hypothetical protein